MVNVCFVYGVMMDKVLHVLANSAPDVNGYAVRTQMILQNQPQDVVGLTSPWYPQRLDSDSKPSFVGKMFRAPGYFAKLGWKVVEKKSS